MKLSRDDFFLCKPVLARGCYLREQGASGVVLIPEGLIKLNDSGFQLLRLCDGQRTLSTILTDLRTEHAEHYARRIEADLEKFILRLIERKVLVLL
jgi:pyrroloquinoline quinone biosynthesis protein D